MRFSAPCLMGTEGLAAQELKELSCENVQAENGRVLFSGGWDILARANINSRYAERIGILMGEFPARSFEELFQGVRALPWAEFLPQNAAFPVTGSSLNSQLHSVPDCQAITKKAVVEAMKARYGGTWLAEDGPMYRIIQSAKHQHLPGNAGAGGKAPLFSHTRETHQRPDGFSIFCR